MFVSRRNDQREECAPDGVRNTSGLYRYRHAEENEVDKTRRCYSRSRQSKIEVQRIGEG